MRLNIDRVQVASTAGVAGDDVALATPHPHGTVLDATNRLLIATADGALEVLQLQPAGKRSMSASEFLRGNRVTPGDRFDQA